MIVAAINLLEDGPRNAIYQLTGSLESGDAETDVLKVDMSTLSLDPNNLKPTNVSIQRIKFNTTNIEVNLQWEAAGNPIALVLPANFSQHHDYRFFGGIPNMADGRTGNILLSTKSRVYPSTDAQYDIVLWVKKRYN